MLDLLLYNLLQNYNSLNILNSPKCWKFNTVCDSSEYYFKLLIIEWHLLFDLFKILFDVWNQICMCLMWLLHQESTIGAKDIIEQLLGTTTDSQEWNNYVKKFKAHWI